MTDEVLKNRTELMQAFADNESGLITAQHSRELVEATSAFYSTGQGGGTITTGSIPAYNASNPDASAFFFTKDVMDTWDRNNAWSIAGFQLNANDDKHLMRWVEDAECIARVGMSAHGYAAHAGDPAPTDGNYRSLMAGITMDREGHPSEYVGNAYANVSRRQAGWDSGYVHWSISGAIIRLRKGSKLRFYLQNVYSSYGLSDVTLWNVSWEVVALGNARDSEAYTPWGAGQRGLVGTVPVGA